MPFFFLRQFKYVYGDLLNIISILLNFHIYRLESAKNREEMETNKAIGEALSSVYTSVIQAAW